METTYGSIQVGADSDGHNGATRGIVKLGGVYKAVTPVVCQDFKTLRGAVAFMARKGYDSHGRRLP